MAGKKRSLTDAEIDFIRSRVPEIGFRQATKEFCSRFRHIGMNTIRDRCKDWGVSSPLKERGGGIREFVLTEDEEFSFISLVTSEGYQVAMAEFGVCEETVRRKCDSLERKYDLEVRSPKAQAVRLNAQTMKEDYFLHWSPAMAYDLGYGFADGAILLNQHGKPQTYHLKCKRSDENIILSMRERFGSNHLVCKFIEVQENGTLSPMTRVAISNSALTKSLIEVHGMMPAKSKRDDPLPFVPPDLLCHFTRGYFDGDGCVWRYDYREKRKTMPGYRFTRFVKGFYFLGTHLFLTQLHDLLVSHANLSSTPVVQNNSTGEAWKIQWQSEGDFQKMRGWLYPLGHYPRLARKQHGFT